MMQSAPAPTLLSLLLIAAAALPAAAQDAQQTFARQCAACHTIGGGRLVGPDLKGVSSRRDRDWLIDFILNPQAAVDRKDPYALQLLQDARGVVMPAVPGVDRALASALLDFIDAESKSGKAAAAPANDRPFSDADVRRGEQLFRGEARLASGAPSCIACHTVRGSGGLGGGQLGPDLTRVYERLNGRLGLTAWLGAPATPTMQSVFATRTLAPDEVGPLVAYFEDAAKQGGEDNRSGAINFVLLGLGAAAFGLVVMDSAWRSRFRAVRRALVPRRAAARS